MGDSLISLNAEGRGDPTGIARGVEVRRTVSVDKAKTARAASRDRTLPPNRSGTQESKTQSTSFTEIHP